MTELLTVSAGRQLREEIREALWSADSAAGLIPLADDLYELIASSQYVKARNAAAWSLGFTSGLRWAWHDGPADRRDPYKQNPFEEDQ